MLSNIKAYQPETASHCFPSQNSISCCTWVACFTKISLSVLTSSCHVHNDRNAKRTKWIRKKAVSWVWFVLTNNQRVKQNWFLNKKI